jgi:hypothetical protein
MPRVPARGSVGGMEPNRITSLLGRAALPLALTLGVGALALGPVLAGPATAAPAAPTPASTAWREVDQISVRNADVEMVGVDALSAGNAWALAEVDYDNGNVKPLVQHWNGRRWRQVAIPARIANSFSQTTLWDSFSVSPDGTIWAFALNSTYLTRSDGRWRKGVLPIRGGRAVEAVAAFSRSDVWAFGSKVDENFNFTGPFAEHFDGRTWQAVRVPGRSDISAVSAVSPGNIYAVTGLLASATPRVLHWNGATWRFLPVQPRVSGLTTIYSILALKHSGVYLAGSVPSGKKTSAALVERGDGRSWSDITPGTAGLRANEIALSLAGAPQRGIWALTANANSNQERIWRRSADGIWSAPTAVPWDLDELTAISHTASTWGCGSVKIRGQYRGVIVLHGPTP